MDAIIGTGKISKREYEIIPILNQSISMSDGINLDVDIFRPDGNDKYPILLATITQNLISGCYAISVTVLPVDYDMMLGCPLMTTGHG